jgi:hypothetical protein
MPDSIEIDDIGAREAHVRGYKPMGDPEHRQPDPNGLITITGWFEDGPGMGVQPDESMRQWERRSQEKFTLDAQAIYEVLSKNLPGGTLHQLMIAMLQGHRNLYVVADLPMPQPDVERALQIAREDGGIAGDHHKAWVIDQMVRALTGDRYAAFVEDAKRGEDGPETYEWNEGIAP